MAFSPVRHSFVEGDVFVVVIDEKRLSQWYVQEVISPNKLIAVKIDDDGFLGKNGRTFEGKLLLGLMKDPLATRLYDWYRSEKMPLVNQQMKAV